MGGRFRDAKSRRMGLLGRNEASMMRPSRRMGMAGDSEGKRKPPFALPILTAICGLGLLSISMFYRPYVFEDHAVFSSFSRQRSACETFRQIDHFGTKSLYVPPATMAPLDENGELLFAYVLARHGSRYPTRKNVVRIAEMHRHLLHAASSASPSWLRHLTNPYSMDLSGALTDRGRKEMYQLGERMWKLYGVQGKMNTTSIETTFKPRAAESGKYIASAWYGGGTAGEELAAKVKVHAEKPLDLTLRFFECGPYNEFRATLKLERERHLSHFKPLSEYLTEALHLKRGLELPLTKIFLHSCMYDAARDDQESNFCALVTADKLLMIESEEEDMESFRAAHQNFPWVAAPLLNDLVQKIKACVDGDLTSCTQMNVRVAHAETLMPLVLLLGLGDVEDPEWHCRTWTAGACPMGANVATELYKDKSGGLYLKFRLNERYVQNIGKCGGKSFCLVEEIEDILRASPTLDEWTARCPGVYHLPEDPMLGYIHEDIEDS